MITSNQIDEALFEWKNVQKVLMNYGNLKSELSDRNEKSLHTVIMDFDKVLEESRKEMTEHQKKIIGFTMQGYSQSEIGRALGVTKQSIQGLQQRLCIRIAKNYRNSYKIKYKK